MAGIAFMALIFILFLGSTPGYSVVNVGWAKILTGTTQGPTVSKTTIDPDGNLIICGSFITPMTVETTTLTPVGLRDCFVAKLSSAGSLIWIRHISGPLIVASQDVATDQQGNIYFVGDYVGSNLTIGTTTLPFVNPSNNGGVDCFIAKMSSNGNHLWAQKIGGVSADFVQSVEVDNNNNPVIAGYFTGTSAVLCNQSMTGTLATSYNGFVAKLSPTNGNVTWSNVLTSTTENQPLQMVVDQHNNIYVLGTYKGSGSGNLNSTQLPATVGNTTGAYLARLSSTGSLVWAQNVMMSTNSSIAVQSLVVDKTGNLYFSGSSGGNFSIGTSSFTSVGGADLFFGSFRVGGAFRWAKSFGSPFHDNTCLVSLNSRGRPFLYLSLIRGFAFSNTAVATSSISLVQSDSTSGDMLTVNSMGSLVPRTIIFDPSDNFILGSYPDLNTTVNGVNYVTNTFAIVTLPASFTVSAPTITTTCTNNTQSLTASLSPGGYLWSNGETTRTITPTVAGSYTVQITSGECTSLASSPTNLTAIVAKPTISMLSSPNGSTLICSGGSQSIVLTTGLTGVTHLWSNNSLSTNLTVTSAGTYTVRVISDGCTSVASDPIVITVQNQPSRPVISASPSTALCPGGTTTLTAPAGFSYLWSNGATTRNIVVSDPGAYTVQTITSPCTSAVSNTITITYRACSTTFIGNGNWTTSSLWQSRITPTDLDSVVIAPGAVAQVSSSVSAKSIRVSTGARLEIGNNGILNLKDVLDNQGTVTVINNSIFGSIVFAGKTKPQSLIIGNPITVNSLTLQNDAALLTGLTVNRSLDISNVTFNANSNRVVLRSSDLGTANFIAKGTASLIGGNNFEVERYMSPTIAGTTGSWIWVGAQTAGQTVNLWSTNNAYTALTYSMASTMGSSVYTLDPSYTAPGNSGYRKPTGPSQAAGIGQGHRIWFRNPDFFVAGNATWRSIGTPLVGNHTWTLSHCNGIGSVCASGGTATNNGWNLIANPYAAVINWSDETSWTKTNITNATYISRSKTANTATFNNGVGLNGGSAFIPSGQGFMVWANGPGASIVVTPNACITTQNPSVLRSAAPQDVVKINISNTSDLQDQIALRWDASATSGFDDHLEAHKMSNLNGVNLSFMQAAEQVAILAATYPTQRISYPFELSLTSADSRYLSFEGLDGLTQPLDFFLEDHQTGQIYPINAQSQIPVTNSSGVNLRYSLITSPGRTTSLNKSIVPNLVLSPNPTSQTTMIQFPEVSVTSRSIQLTNQVGQLIQTIVVPAGTQQHQLDIQHLAPGVYILSTNGHHPTKLIKE